MIFVTVGTHEQPFDRLIKQLDKLKKSELIKDNIFIQVGYSRYKPSHCKYKKFLKYEEVLSNMDKSRIIITHGGETVLLALIRGKTPIVVPRQKKYGEHVDNHQVLFSKTLEEEKKVIAVYEIKDLVDKVINYDSIIQSMRISHNYQEAHKGRVENFAKRLDKICQELCKSVI